MTYKWRRNATALALVSCLAVLAPACVIRARARVKPVYVVTEEPPPPKYRTVQPRAGHVWVRGHYEYRKARWVWVPGHWERARAGKRWEPGYWQRHGNQWRWHRGRWVAAAAPPAAAPMPRATPATPPPRVRDHRQPAPPRVAYPTAPPPAPRYARPGARAGYVWIQGHYEWKAGRYMWIKGHWERARKGKRWVGGRWVKKGNRYVWEKGYWEVATPRGKVRDHRH